MSPVNRRHTEKLGNLNVQATGEEEGESFDS
jgi:hypothetical protein